VTLAPPTLSQVPFVYLSYDEPWADAGWADLRAKVPGAVRVHGVKGLDACHKAAAEAAGTDHFVTIDADTTVDAGIGDTMVPRALISDKVRLVWPSRNAVNGLVSGNGSVKLWPRALVMAMRTHEAAPPDTLSLDHDLGDVEPGVTRSVDMPGALATTDPARTPRHAFRAGFREGTYLDRLLFDRAHQHGADSPRLTPLVSILTVWACLGRHAPNGLWMLYGVRLALWLARADPGRDLRVLNDYGALDALWSDWVLPRFAPGGTRCRWTGDTWDAALLADEVEALGARLTGMGVPGLAEIGAEESRLIAGAGVLPTTQGGGALDGLGWAMVQGKGLRRDKVAARVWFEAAHALGNAGAPLNLAKLAEAGEITGRSADEIRRLYRIAVARGNPWAPDRLAAFEASLAPSVSHQTDPSNRGEQPETVAVAGS
jgi:hypothetical protein